MEVHKLNLFFIRFLEDLLFLDGKPLDEKMVVVTKGYHKVFEDKPPLKKEDPECFNIMVTIKDFYLGEVMCVLRSSGNMMSLSLFKKIGGLELKPCDVTIDGSMC